ncbi:IS1182 family transposase [Streptomyces sp. CB02400]|uniref:IS1182 family transposase n=1 Tax=Streptomyces sp. CB02400 TaxID=1703944 RepID=UPI0009A0DB59|nr:IS1182 family transposase [Streptomyces sp. CB02400]
MSMQPMGPGKIPTETVRVARAAFPKGSLAITVRDELGPLFGDEEFADLFPSRGRPAWSPGRLALVLVLQFVEGLTDRQAAEAVRARIDFKYALGLDLENPGFDYSVLSEFRDRLVHADAGRRVLDGILVAARDKGLLKTAGRARTDSTHVLSAARELSWLEMVTETLRAALNALAQAAPEWLGRIAERDWFRHYSVPASEFGYPKGRARREEMALRVGRDGMRLLQAVWSVGAPEELRTLQQVETLRHVWVQCFQQVEGAVRNRAPKDRPRGAMRLVTPYDTEARGSIKQDLHWNGYKVHFTETCEPDAPNLITNVVTTTATVPDDRMTTVIHAALAGRAMLPAEHWVDTGYANAGAMADARAHGVALHGPLKSVTNAQARAGAYGQDAFTVDWDSKRVTCPNGTINTGWREDRSQQGLPVVRAQFSARDCRPCPVVRDCVPNFRAKGRAITLRPQQAHRELQQARTLQQTDEWKERYKVRAGIEGTISQGVHSCDLRRSRYRGLAKTSLQHQLTGAAINLARINAHIIQMPRARTRVSHFAALLPIK